MHAHVHICNHRHKHTITYTITGTHWYSEHLIHTCKYVHCHNRCDMENRAHRRLELTMYTLASSSIPFLSSPCLCIAHTNTHAHTHTRTHIHVLLYTCGHMQSVTLILNHTYMHAYTQKISSFWMKIFRHLCSVGCMLTCKGTAWLYWQTTCIQM